MNRRALLRGALGTSGVVLASGLGSLAHIWVVRGVDAGELTTRGKQILGHMSRGVLSGFLAANASQRQRLLQVATQRVEAGAANLPRLVKLQLGGLLGAMESPPSRYLLTGVNQPWSEVSDAQVAQACLRSWLTSPCATWCACRSSPTGTCRP
jgi:hypothetical protein